MKRLVVAAIFSLVFAAHLPALAESKQLNVERSPRYYRTHVGLAAAGVVATVAAERIFRGHGAGPYWRSFYGDDLVEVNFSDSAASLSDKLLLTTIVLPGAVQISEGFDVGLGNSALVYAEAHALNLALTITTKLTVRRPRPYTRSESPSMAEFMAKQGSGAYVSFFSGHASTAFTAASAGSVLYSMRSEDPWARHTVWGFEFLLAGMTAQLRVYSGRHYRSDIWIGSMVGASVGLLVPALHQLPLSRVRGTEVATAGAAAVVTMALSEVVDFCGVLGALGLCHLPRDGRVRMLARASSPPQARWFVLPAVYEGGGGFRIDGDF